jgi:signal transduction histidine kinase
MIRSLSIIYIVIIFCISGLPAQNIFWDGKTDQINIADKILILEDAEDKLSIEDVQSESYRMLFKASDKIILNFGFTESAYWLRFDLDNSSEADLLLELGHTHLENVSFYRVEDSLQLSQIKAGYSIPVPAKQIKHHFQVFPLSPGKHQYHVKISPPVQPLPVRIYASSAYEIKTYQQRLVFGFYLGLMFFVILSNLFFYISLRNKLFLFYSAIVLLYISYASTVMDGFIVYFTPGIDLKFWYLTIPTIGVPIQMIYALVFLEIRKWSPKLYKRTTILISYFIIYAIIRFWLPLTAVLALNTIHALISFFGMFYLGYFAGKKGNRLGYYFAMAYLIYFILVLTEATYVQIGKPAYFMELSHVAWATLIEAFVLSFLLSKRFEWERAESEKQKIFAQDKLIEKTRENEKMVREQNVLLEERVEERTKALNDSLENLKNTQAKLIQSEKLASLGELTAGIAHEIQNPLNFVNNFSEISVELCEELNDEIEKMDLPTEKKSEIHELTYDLMENQKKINFHGKRADSIVKGMLQHSRRSSGTKELTDINKLAEEYLRLSYHGHRAKDKSFNTKLITEFDPEVGNINVLPQDFGRVILNLLTNAFYAVSEKAEKQNNGYEPLVTMKTVSHPDSVDIIIQDNGNGIPESIQSKIFQPFFTTKPTGKGTGLGLSLSYEIITSGHGGQISVDSTPGGGTIFKISLPRGNAKI